MSLGDGLFPECTCTLVSGIIDFCYFYYYQYMYYYYQHYFYHHETTPLASWSRYVGGPGLIPSRFKPKMLKCCSFHWLCNNDLYRSNIVIKYHSLTKLGRKFFQNIIISQYALQMVFKNMTFLPIYHYK